MFMFLQGGRAFALKIAHLKDPELRKLAPDLPLRTTEAKAPSTTERYSRAFQKFREWSSPYNEVICLPSDEIVALYLVPLILPLSLLAMVLIEGIICIVFKVPAILNWLRTYSR